MCCYLYKELKALLNAFIPAHKASIYCLISSLSSVWPAHCQFHLILTAVVLQAEEESSRVVQLDCQSGEAKFHIKLFAGGLGDAGRSGARRSYYLVYWVGDCRRGY